MLSEQILLNGGPLLVRAEDGAAAAGFIFNVLMLARAPLLVFQGIAISLLPHLTRLRSRGGEDAAEAFQVSVGTTLRAVAAFTALVAVVVAIAGPELMQIAFSDRFEYDREGLLIVTAAMGLYLAATTLNQATLAQGQARRACVAWGVCAVGFLVWSLLPVLAADRRIEIGFLAAAAALFCLLRWIYDDPRDLAAGLSPTEEIEARLALADEAS
jgi:O-antigen/teichoic acid export membrane protein